MPRNTNKPLTAESARELAKRIVKDAKSVRVKFGQTNGRICLHVFVPGDNALSRTIYSETEWGSHPANDHIKKRNRENAETEVAPAAEAVTA